MGCCCCSRSQVGDKEEALVDSNGEDRENNRMESDAREDTKVVKEEENVVLISRGWSPGFTVRKDHVHKKVVEMYECLEGCENFDSNELLQLWDSTTITQDDLKMWVSYSGNTLFTSLTDARHRFSTVVDYCNGTSCTNEATNRLKFIAQELIENPKKHEPVGILLLLASHGNVCNVMKEVGIQTAYSNLTNQTAKLFNTQGIEDRIYQLLREFRHNAVEELYASFGAVNNTHSITMMKNYLASRIGINTTVDNYEGNWGLPENWKDGLEYKFWNKHYTVEKIARWIFIACNEEPRKIPYDLLISFFEKNTPINDVYLFYSDVFQMEHGFLKTRYICWMLNILGVFHGPDIIFEVPEIPSNNGMEYSSEYSEFEEFSNCVRSETCDFEDVHVQKGSYGHLFDEDILPQGHVNPEQEKLSLVQHWQKTFAIYRDDPVLKDSF